ncbi:hypothetical protein [Deinococcus sp. JMULE3]|uniref:alginate O-acetyltransferase AlgX-related protein n=1 Tax=Deinococcus sp. JMULE3 TaxID=2518341 RepID=UPI0015763C0E|nr:hypothetical protein [Deinococcus sp. JMULE3]NTX98925.1 hypothetical protein [Deinococcus sp. JMULE3]
MNKPALILTALLATSLARTAAQTAARVPAAQVPAACGQTLEQKAWMFQGQKDWFFYGDELSGTWTGRPWKDARATFVPGAAQLHAALKARGVQLILAPVPPRSFVVPQHLNPASAGQKAFDPAAATAFYQGLVGDLRAAGIPTADLLTPARTLGDAGLFRQDIHWTPEGAQAAARAVASAMQAGGVPAGTEAYLSLRAGTLTRQVQDQPVLGQISSLCSLNVTPETFGDYQTRPAQGLVAAPGNFGGSEGAVRWAFGPVASVTFNAAQAAPVTVNATFENPVGTRRSRCSSAGRSSTPSAACNPARTSPAAGP